MAGPEHEVIAGRRPVEEAFAARREAVRLLVVPQRRDALQQMVLHATALRIQIVEVEGGPHTITQAEYDAQKAKLLGFRLRYEITKEFAPYVGVHWERKLGDTADHARAAGDKPSATSLAVRPRVRDRRRR